MKNSRKKYIVITGASSGIGYAAAQAFAARRKNLIIAARRRGRLDELRRDILAKYPMLDIVPIDTDLRNCDNVRQFYQALQPYWLEGLINCAGFGHYGSVAEQDLEKIQAMLAVNVEALTLLSSLFVRDYKDCDAQLINISSAGGYTIVPNAVAYCATKFYVSAFTEGLAAELKMAGAKLKAKVLAPAATKTEFGQTAEGTDVYDYDAHFSRYHTATEMADFLLRLYDSDMVVGVVNREDFSFRLGKSIFPYAAETTAENQK